MYKILDGNISTCGLDLDIIAYAQLTLVTGRNISSCLHFKVIPGFTRGQRSVEVLGTLRLLTCIL
jgi:hypothetical protein